jgi:cyclopropane fatty-acyl-phospholipid synthase-like methyltransferase
MTVSPTQLAGVETLLRRPEFPRSAAYDTEWVLRNQMGPNALWLAEWLCEALPLRPGMRVLDLGCGRAMTSIFLAREFGVQVWAADLWITPDHNYRRAVEAGAGDVVFPIRTEAHALPFADGFFDVVISIDAWQYFGTDALYLDYLARFVAPGGSIGVVCVGLAQPLDNVPPHLAEPQSNGKVFWEDSCWSFRTADWWARQWQRSRAVTAVRADELPDGWRHWRDFEHAIELSGLGHFPSDAEALDTDAGRWISFVRVVATRTGEVGENLYDATLGARAGVDG